MSQTTAAPALEQHAERSGQRVAGGPDFAAAAEAWVAHFEEGWRAPAGPDALADHFIPLLDPQIRLVQPQIPTLVGYQAFREGFARPLFRLIPDLHGEVRHWAARDGVVFIALTLRGTLGGRPVSWDVVDQVTLGPDGRARERRSYTDPTPLLLAGVTRPRAWTRLARLQGRNLMTRLKGAPR
jgi:hypothetical protein